MKKSSVARLGFMLAVSLLAPATADAAVSWGLVKKHGQAFLNAMPTVEESDYEFWALCKGGGQVEIGAGADTNVGKGEGESVSLQFKSGKATAKLQGKSLKSDNFEMTGGTELRATIGVDDPLFAVLAAGAPIAVSGSIKKPIRLRVTGLKPKVAAFVAACKK